MWVPDSFLRIKWEKRGEIFGIYLQFFVLLVQLPYLTHFPDRIFIYPLCPTFSNFRALLQADYGLSYVFAKPCSKLLEIWQRVCMDSNIEFDLIYAPRAWQLITHELGVESEEKGNLLDIKSRGILSHRHRLLYYHCGGIAGNQSQLDRYRYLGILENEMLDNTVSKPI